MWNIYKIDEKVFKKFLMYCIHIITVARRTDFHSNNSKQQFSEHCIQHTLCPVRKTVIKLTVINCDKHLNWSNEFSNQIGKYLSVVI